MMIDALVCDNGAQDLEMKIEQHYRVRLILDNLPVTTYDLLKDTYSMRPGFELGFLAGGKHYINNHLMFKILVHKTNGQYTRNRKRAMEMEAASIVEGGNRKLLGSGSWDEAQVSALGSESPATRQLQSFFSKAQSPPPPSPVPSGGKKTSAPMYMVVGFEVSACSIFRKPGESQLYNIPCPESLEDPDAPKLMEVKSGAQLLPFQLSSLHDPHVSHPQINRAIAHVLVEFRVARGIVTAG